MRTRIRNRERKSKALRGAAEQDSRAAQHTPRRAGAPYAGHRTLPPTAGAEQAVDDGIDGRLRNL
jgi:hypothetical protein